VEFAAGTDGARSAPEAAPEEGLMMWIAMLALGVSCFAVLWAFTRGCDRL
jgi:hypothetical protein